MTPGRTGATLKVDMSLLSNIPKTPSPIPEIVITPVDPDDFSLLPPLPDSPMMAARFSLDQKVFLHDLPSEVVCRIAMHAGFFAALKLLQSCKRFKTLLSNPASWFDYHHLSTDHLENYVSIVTKVHTFDHLVFGHWEGDFPTSTPKPAKPSSEWMAKGTVSSTQSLANSLSTLAEDNPEAGPASLSSAALAERAVVDKTTLFFEHCSFFEGMDFLGGVTLTIHHRNPNTLLVSSGPESCSIRIASDFFEHRETLPCYKRELNSMAVQGLVPLSQPSGEASLARIQHSCAECQEYDGRKVLESIFVFERIPENPKWGRDGFCWDYELSKNSRGGRKVISIRVRPYVGVMGYSSMRDLPFVSINAISINGRALQGWALDSFKALVGW